jgi:two-component system cell cycle sensor histidine kinase/response regulator CckA
VHEVTGRAVKLLLELLERQGYDSTPLVDGLSMDGASLRSGRGWFSWELWVELVERIERDCGGADTLDRMGSSVNELPVPHEFKKVARLFWSARRLYRLNSRWGVSADFRCIRSECIDLDTRHLRVTMSIPSEMRGSTAAFRLVGGVLRGLPRLIDEAPATVHAEIGPHGGTYTIALPPPATLGARLRRGLAPLVGVRTAVEQLEAQQQEIVEQNRLLEQQLIDQRRVEAALRESEARWRLLAETLRKSEEQLRQAQKMEAIGRLAGGVAHDFNNLLSVVLGYSAMLLGRLPRDGRDAADVKEIHDAGQRAAVLTRQLLAFSRQAVLAPTVTDLNEVVARIERMLGRLIGEDIELRFHPGVDLHDVKVDQAQIEQVILNLVVNARDAMSVGGVVTIETRNVCLDELHASTHFDVRPGPHVMLAVSDTGVGIAPEQRALVFEPFFTTKEKGSGTGLGLAMVRGIVQQSGGSLWLYSELGVGTTMKIYLPVTSDTRPPVADAIPATHAREGTETILLVEDEPQVRAIASAILGRQGYRVLEAANPSEALALTARNTETIHLLLTDVILPQMNGRELARKLVADRRDLKVLFMSGYAETTIAHRGVLDHGVTLLQKPFSIDSLTRHVRNVLDA